VAESNSHAIPPSTSSFLDVAAKGAVLVHLVSPHTHTGRVKLLWYAIVAALLVDALHLCILLRLVVLRADSWRR
jgi:ABC-type enterochelin transport system permease subunit